MSSYKNAAVSFLKLITEGRISEAFDTYISSHFIHHNPYFKGDALSLKIGMEEHHKLFPTKTYEVKHAIAETDFVAVHGRVQLVAGGKTVVVVHIFRFENDKIVELWDVGEEIPKDSPNKNGMF